MATKLTAKQNAFVAAYIGSAKGNATEAARIAGYKGNDETLRAVGHENLTKPHIAAQIAAHRATIESRAIADLQTRIDGYNERRNALLRIVAERAIHPDYAKVPGGRTGWLVRTIKQIGGGENAQIVEEYAFDAALHRELRELEKQAAQDLGQWQDRKSVDITVTIRKKAEQLAGQLGISADELIAEAEAIAAGSWDAWSPR